MKYKMMKNGVVVAVILLFFGVAVAPSITAIITKTGYMQSQIDTSLENSFHRIRELIDSITLHKRIVQPMDVLPTLEEIMKILKDNDIKNYIGEDSNRDCDCENEKATRWSFPVLCTLLYPLYIFGTILSHLPFLYLYFLLALMQQIGEGLNCFWITFK